MWFGTTTKAYSFDPFMIVTLYIVSTMMRFTISRLKRWRYCIALVVTRQR